MRQGAVRYLDERQDTVELFRVVEMHADIHAGKTSSVDCSSGSRDTRRCRDYA